MQLAHNRKLFDVAKKSSKTTIPFVKDNEFNYSDLITWISPDFENYAWVITIYYKITVSHI